MAYPKTSKSLRFRTIGGDLQVEEQEVDPLDPYQLLIKVHAASINPVDIQLWRSGLVGVVSGDKGMGRDYSGTVVAAGRYVKGWVVGDEVFGLLFSAFGQGTFSEYVNINPDKEPIAKKPGALTHEQAASLPLVVLTAYACLEWLPPASGTQRRVIIRGASGGTGSWLVQVAKAGYDCHVTAICSKKNEEYVKSLGADEVIDYTSQDIASTLLSQRTANKEYDLLVDCVGGTDLLSTYPKLLHKSGAYVTIVGDKTDVKRMGGSITYITNPIQILRYITGWIFGPRYACVSLLTNSQYLQKVAALAERGEVKAEVQEVLQGAFDERQAWKKAVSLMEEGRVRGKVVIAVP